jgi:hypothetical protein
MLKGDLGVEWGGIYKGGIYSWENRQLASSGLPAAPWRTIFVLDSGGPHIYDAYDRGIWTGGSGLEVSDVQLRMSLGCHNVSDFLSYFTVAMHYVRRVDRLPSALGWEPCNGFEPWLPCGWDLRYSGRGILNIIGADRVGFAIDLDRLLLVRKGA